MNRRQWMELVIVLVGAVAVANAALDQRQRHAQEKESSSEVIPDDLATSYKLYTDDLISFRCKRIRPITYTSETRDNVFACSCLGRNIPSFILNHPFHLNLALQQYNSIFQLQQCKRISKKIKSGNMFYPKRSLRRISPAVVFPLKNHDSVKRKSLAIINNFEMHKTDTKGNQNTTEVLKPSASSVESMVTLATKDDSMLPYRSRASSVVIPYLTENSESIKFSRKYNPNSKASDSGFVPVPGPYGFKSVFPKFPRLGRYNSESAEDITSKGSVRTKSGSNDFNSPDFTSFTADHDDDLGTRNFDILRGGIFSYEEDTAGDNYSKQVKKPRTSSSGYNKLSKDSESRGQGSGIQFPYFFARASFAEHHLFLPASKNNEGTSSQLISVTSELEASD